MSIDDNILDKTSKQKAVMLKALSAEISTLEKRVSACGDNLQSNVDRIRKAAVSLKNTHVLRMIALIDKENSDEEKRQKLITNTSIIQSSFDDFVESIADHITFAATTVTDDASIDIVFDSIANLKGCDEMGEVVALTGSGKATGVKLDAILMSFRAGVKSQKEQYNAIEERDNSKKKYNDILYGE